MTTITDLHRPRRGDWMLTYNGRQFWPFDPRPGDFEVTDIAHALANLCRFGGHGRQFYSVAQHSVFVSRIVKPRLLAFVALMHDATEAYCGDLIRAVKSGLPSYREMEDAIWQALARQFTLPSFIPDEVKLADNIAVVTERRDILCFPYRYPWNEYLENLQPSTETIVPVNAKTAEKMWLREYEYVTRYLTR